MKELKMYYFNPNSYSTEYFTIAPDKETALENVKKYLYSKTIFEEGHEPSYYCYKDLYTDDYNYWKDITVDNLPRRYTIEVVENGGVIETEIS